MMTGSERQIWQQLEAAHSGELSLEEFERWLVVTPGVEQVTGAESYLEFISINFTGRHAAHHLMNAVDRAYQKHRPGELVYDRARRVAMEFLEGRRDLWRTASYFALLWSFGHGAWVPKDFHTIDIELEDIPAPEAHHEAQPAPGDHDSDSGDSRLREYTLRARAAAEQLLQTLDSRSTNSSI